MSTPAHSPEANSDREIVISRVLHAPRELVWEAWTNPRHVANWWGPRGFTTTIKQMDFRVGGVWEHTMHGPDGTNYPNKSVFKEIVPFERITYSHGGGREDAQTQGATFVATWTFETMGPRETRLTVRMVFPSKETRDRVVRDFGAIEGGQQTLERAADYLKGMSARPRVRVHCFTISLDGFGAGPNQDLSHPLGEGGGQLHPWMLETRTARQMFGLEGGMTGADDDFVARGNAQVGAWILGRNMFGPVRGPWPDRSWKGWWGENPVYHVPVFVLTHHPREPEVMAGGTTFHFVTGGIHEALQKASAAAAGKDVRVGGGVSTVRQFLQAGLVDEMHLAVAPVLLGSGERLFDGIDLPRAGYALTGTVSSPRVTHLLIGRKAVA